MIFSRTHLFIILKVYFWLIIYSMTLQCKVTHWRYSAGQMQPRSSWKNRYHSQCEVPTRETEHVASQLRETNCGWDCQPHWDNGIQGKWQGDWMTPHRVPSKLKENEARDYFSKRTTQPWLNRYSERNEKRHSSFRWRFPAACRGEGSILS